MLKGIAFVKDKGVDYMDLYGRKLVDAATAMLIGHLLLQQAGSTKAPGGAERKKLVARRFIDTNLPTVERDILLLCSGDTSALTDFETLAGPPPGLS